MLSESLQVVVAHRPPFVNVANLSGSPYFSGMLVDLLNKILATSNTTIKYEMYLSPANAGGTLSGGTWNGVVGELVNGRADVSLFPLTRTASRLTAIDCSFSYYDAGLSLLVRDGAKSPGPLSVLAPFATTLWVTLFCTVIGVALLFWALDVYGRWIRAKQMEALRASGVLSDRAVARAKRDDGNPVLISFMAAAGAPERPGRNSWGVQVLYVVYCFFCLIVLSSYTANLAVRRAYVGVTGLQDLMRENGMMGVNPNGSTAAYFASSKDMLANQLQPNVRYCETPVCVEWVRQGAVSAFVSDEPLLTYLSQRHPCDLEVVGDPFGPGSLVIGFQKNSSLLSLFNNAIQAFSEDGTLSSLRRAWFDALSQCEDSSTDLANSQLTIGQMLGAFVFLIMGVLVAFVTGTIENLKWCLARDYARSYSEVGMQTMLNQSLRDQASRGSLEQPFLSNLSREVSGFHINTWNRLSNSLLGITVPPTQARIEEQEPCPGRATTGGLGRSASSRGPDRTSSPTPPGREASREVTGTAYTRAASASCHGYIAASAGVSFKTSSPAGVSFKTSSPAGASFKTSSPTAVVMEINEEKLGAESSAGGTLSGAMTDESYSSRLLPIMPHILASASAPGGRSSGEGLPGQPEQARRPTDPFGQLSLRYPRSSRVVPSRANSCTGAFSPTPVPRPRGGSPPALPRQDEVTSFLDGDCLLPCESGDGGAYGRVSAPPGRADAGGEQPGCEQAGGSASAGSV